MNNDGSNAGLCLLFPTLSEARLVLEETGFYFIGYLVANMIETILIG